MEPQQSREIKFNELSHGEQHKIEQKTDRKLIPPKLRCLYLDWGRRYYDMDGFEVATIQTSNPDL